MIQQYAGTPEQSVAERHAAWRRVVTPGRVPVEVGGDDGYNQEVREDDAGEQSLAADHVRWWWGTAFGVAPPAAAGVDLSGSGTPVRYG
ncbi:hypothetical protein BRC89_12555 [Halobacteriales archaeon QS_4_70_19]|nr:MAG: hypothetical protein BRC89_12555 [Halobacteriales archaeon QS_4_70_19]